MNKGRRNEIKMLKFKKRIKLNKVDESAHSFRTSSVPCSCWACRGTKYRDSERSLSRIGKRIAVEDYFIGDDIYNNNVFEISLTASYGCRPDIIHGGFKQTL